MSTVIIPIYRAFLLYHFTYAILFLRNIIRAVGMFHSTALLFINDALLYAQSHDLIVR